MNFSYDLVQAEPVIKDMRVYHTSAITRGMVATHGIAATAEMQGCATPAVAATASNTLGTFEEEISAADALSVVATGVDFYGKVMINPFAIYRAKYSQLAADDTPTSTTTQKILTGTSVTDHERGWAYVTDVGSSTDGFGNLFQIGASTSTTAIVAATDFDDNMVATSNSDTFIVMPAPFSADVIGYGCNLAANISDIRGYAGTGGAAIMVLENYIDNRAYAMQALRASVHSGRNFATDAAQFYADVYLADSVFLSAAARVIS